MSKRKHQDIEGEVDEYFHGRSIKELTEEADRNYVMYTHHVDESEQYMNALIGDDMYCNAMRAYLVGRHLDVLTTWDEVMICRVALEYNHRLQSKDKSSLKSTDEQYEVYQQAINILVDEYNSTLARKADRIKTLKKKACLALFGTIGGRISINYDKHLTFSDVRCNFDIAISHRDKRVVLEMAAKKKNDKVRVTRGLTIEDCQAWMKPSKGSASSKSSDRTAGIGDGIPIGTGSMQIKVTTVVEEESTKEEMSPEEIQEALAELPNRLREITDGRPLDVVFGLTEGWSPEDEGEDESCVQIGDTPLSGADFCSRVVDFDGCVITRQFEREILRGMNDVRFLKPDNKDRRMRIATEVPDGVLFTMGSGDGISVYGSQPAAPYEIKLLKLGKALFAVERELVEEKAKEKGKVAPEVKDPDALQTVAGKIKKSSYHFHDDSGPFLVDIGTDGPRPFTKRDLQTLTFALCNHPNAAEVVWSEGSGEKPIASVKTGKRAAHWQLQDSQLFKHAVNVNEKISIHEVHEIERIIFSLRGTGWTQKTAAEVKARLRHVGADKKKVNRDYLYTNLLSVNRPLGRMVEPEEQTDIAVTTNDHHIDNADDIFMSLGNIDLNCKDIYDPAPVAEEDKRKVICMIGKVSPTWEQLVNHHFLAELMRRRIRVVLVRGKEGKDRVEFGPYCPKGKDEPLNVGDVVDASEVYSDGGLNSTVRHHDVWQSEHSRLNIIVLRFPPKNDHIKLGEECERIKQNKQREGGWFMGGNGGCGGTASAYGVEMGSEQARREGHAYRLPTEQKIMSFGNQALAAIHSRGGVVAVFEVVDKVTKV